jgi:osmotically inducible lipoprotein OsmB
VNSAGEPMPAPRGDATMNQTRPLTIDALLTAAILLGLMGCAGMSTQGQNTAIGAGIGAVGGAVLTNGSPLGTIGGAVVGGVVGHEAEKSK